MGITAHTSLNRPAADKRTPGPAPSPANVAEAMKYCQQLGPVTNSARGLRAMAHAFKPQKTGRGAAGAGPSQESNGAECVKSLTAPRSPSQESNRAECVKSLTAPRSLSQESDGAECVKSLTAPQSLSQESNGAECVKSLTAPRSPSQESNGVELLVETIGLHRSAST